MEEEEKEDESESETEDETSNWAAKGRRDCKFIFWT